MWHKNLKLLIVDDEKDICASAQAYFVKRGLNVSTAGSGLDALFVIPIFKPDVIILDLTLNDLNGVDVLRKLRENDRETKVIVITGNLYPQERIEEISALGVSAYLNKVRFGLAELEEIINRVTGNKITSRKVKTETNIPASQKTRPRARS